MPGISGIIQAHPDAEAMRRHLRAFAEVHDLPGIPFIRGEFIDDHCAILNLQIPACARHGHQPARDLADGRVLFVEGEVYDQDALMEHLDDTRRAGVGRGLAWLLLALHGRPEGSLLPFLNGHFNVVVYTPSQNRLEIYNDYLAQRPLYYAHRGQTLLFGSEKKALVIAMETAPRVDPLGVLELIAFRHNLNDRTVLEGVRAFPCASRLVYERGRVALVPYERLRFQVSARRPRIEAVLEEWADALRRATARSMAGKRRVVLALSGGLDSRAVACAIPREFRPIVARTRGNPNSLEVRCAGRVATALGFSHLVQPTSATRYSDWIRPIVWRTECGVPFIGCMSIVEHGALRTHGDFLMGGQFGDASSGGHIKPFMLLPRARERFREVGYRDRKKVADSDLADIFTSGFLRRYLPDLRESFRTSFDAIDEESNIGAFEIWGMTQRQVRYTLNAAPVDSHLFERVMPFLDREYVSFILRLPARLRIGQLAYMAMIERLGPELRGIPYANTGRIIRRTVLGNGVHMGLYAAEYAWGLAWRRRRLGRSRSATAPDSTASDVARDDGLRDLLTSFVRSDSCDPEIFNRDGIVALLEAQDASRAARWLDLATMATLAVGLDYFVVSPRRRCPDEAMPLSD
ncbi:MAG: hypothetical protein HY613_09220 [Candidatus Rokubacteria bacterium]|nr:hypothetical protein [Candidatus Rokubacteria bacterium]